MLFQYANVLLGFIFGLLFVVMNVFVVVRLLSPRGRDKMTGTTYECGEPPVGEAWVRFDMRFYTMALIFIIFEVEAVFLFPWAAVFNDLIQAGGMFVFFEAAIFIAILGVGLIYVWKKGDMDWVKASTNNQPTSWTRPQPDLPTASGGSETQEEVA
jgi:NADH-quinone oxidoreductase subunit A